MRFLVSRRPLHNFMHPGTKPCSTVKQFRRTGNPHHCDTSLHQPQLTRRTTASKIILYLTSERSLIRRVLPSCCQLHGSYAPHPARRTDLILSWFITVAPLQHSSRCDKWRLPSPRGPDRADNGSDANSTIPTASRSLMSPLFKDHGDLWLGSLAAWSALMRPSSNPVYIPDYISSTGPSYSS
ncbi:hypothetical protein BCR34DRAFT_561543 [Clohesyomyces aquaticus]|uniref:Uncharacterized protein n=1 Tax=Clohesyomyces aquaticus TaxID=1231657 RepID=A0A1Y1ZTZ7_9PLEO|nr:hypothetical protein BCR34DRAFT_561543 [Clohesyomyces aquaticus]